MLRVRPAAAPGSWDAGETKKQLKEACRDVMILYIRCPIGPVNPSRNKMSNKTLPVAAMLLAFVLISACAGERVQPAGAAPSPESSEYLVGPGDGLQIFVWDHTDLSSNVEVRPDGKISTPLVEDLQAAGKSPTMLARDIEKVLAQYVRSPVVTVIVQRFVGASDQQVRVVGQAVTPKAVRYRQGMTVLDVVIEVGGLSQFAAGNRARIVRSVGGKETEIRVRLEDLINGGRIEENVQMLPGDVLIIPQSIL
jgi:polysaccharide biosynthesis/export protein